MTTEKRWSNQVISFHFHLLPLMLFPVSCPSAFIPFSTMMPPLCLSVCQSVCMSLCLSFSFLPFLYHCLSLCLAFSVFSLFFLVEDYFISRTVIKLCNFHTSMQRNILSRRKGHLYTNARHTVGYWSLSYQRHIPFNFYLLHIYQDNYWKFKWWHYILNCYKPINNWLQSLNCKKTFLNKKGYSVQTKHICRSVLWRQHTQNHRLPTNSNKDNIIVWLIFPQHLRCSNTETVSTDSWS